MSGQVLMLAGSEGLNLVGIINAANELGLTGLTPWDQSNTKKSHISAVNLPVFQPRKDVHIRQETFVV
jgi:hypothetical protein